MQDKNEQSRAKVEKYLQTKAYFPFMQLVLCTLVLAPILTYAIGEVSILVMAIILDSLVVLLWLLARRRKSVILKDKEFDDFFWQEMSLVKDFARKKLLLSEEDEISEPQEIWASAHRVKKPFFMKRDLKGEVLSNKVFVGQRKGKDGFIRFSPVNVSIVFFTEDKLLTYQCMYDMVSGNQLDFSTRKYYYNEIVSIDTQAFSKTKNSTEIVRKFINWLTIGWVNLSRSKEIQENFSEKFSIKTRGGNSLDIYLPEDRVLGATTHGENLVSRADIAVRSVEKMVDGKKIQ